MDPSVKLELDQRVRLRKPHPCGGSEWRVVRLGADIGLKCETCGRRVLLTRRVLAKRLKRILDEGQAS
ncbi:MAG: DUF951 domain-containing protein [Anaerolineales bacterium]|jgi:hypothetical protein|nr:hypothetical protein [Anaerolineaceae bacterium]MDP7544683.1 DUF951 domain-containing protein [Anaerolineales bacterium]MDP7644893.1 DUF951 domain-containing protein [Anaerolineales bacterium]HJL70427.1 DUF951 domain-containing protein [Anaerolineales bacterium]